MLIPSNGEGVESKHTQCRCEGLDRVVTAFVQKGDDEVKNGGIFLVDTDALTSGLAEAAA